MPNFTKKSKIGGLIINRKVGEQITINNGEITIEIVEIHGKEVRLAFRAHKDIKIDRTEIVPLDQKTL